MSDVTAVKLDRLREALDVWWETHPTERSYDDEVAVTEAARRFLALTETGPDYEAACWALVDSHTVDVITEIGGLTLGDVILAVDAALADYLTEEE